MNVLKVTNVRNSYAQFMNTGPGVHWSWKPKSRKLYDNWATFKLQDILRFELQDILR